MQKVTTSETPDCQTCINWLENTQSKELKNSHGIPKPNVSPIV